MKYSFIVSVTLVFQSGHQETAAYARIETRTSELSAHSLVTAALEVSEERKPKEIFEDIEKGLTQGDVKMFSKYFDRQLLISHRGLENGYFSGNQAQFILQSFFNARRTLHFKFTTINRATEPYATGGGTFSIRGGQRELLQIYVALSRVGGRWVIAEFNVY